MNYHDVFKRSIEDPEGFWGEQAQAIRWYEAPTTVLSQNEQGFYRWFRGGKMNTAYLALDYHVEQGRGKQTALIYDSPVTDTIRKYTYLELRDEVAKFAGVLAGLGVSKGDRVVIYMPMVPEAAIAMLACARLGAVHSVVFGGFAPNELAVRIDDAKPKVMVSASCGIEAGRVIPYKPLLDKSIELAKHKPDYCVILKRPQENASLISGRDYEWNELMTNAAPAECMAVDATDPLYILYTSGTTGKPKGIVRDNGGHAVALRYSMQAIYDVNPGDVFWAGSDVGWVVGHSYIVYAPLLTGCTTILFEGKPVRTPDAGTYWRIISEHQVKTFFTAPTAFRAIKKEDPQAEFLRKYDISSLKYLFLAGERLDPPTYHWLKERLPNIPVVDHWWQTESGWPMVANPMGIDPMEVHPGSATMPVPGYNVQLLSHDGKRITEANKAGNIVVKLPLPPGCLPTLWNDDERFSSSYLTQYPGYYLSGDGGYLDEDGYVFIMGRIDDVINVAGHRLSTGEMEEIVASHPAVAECSVFGINDDLRGQVPVGLVVLKDGVSVDKGALEKELIEMVRKEIGSFAYFRQAAIVQRLPKTRSGKILRHVMRKIADGEEYTVPSTIDDPKILEEIKETMDNHHIGQAFQE
ncbi:MAG: propionyl-CoA synthetase [Calditrichaeota bacterium]|nr:propionyl-CoA synthetase [Calditrichota bacterium]MCB0306855.1 propionyl-CoA synthetase [Calditrichota bacterium]